MFKVQINDSCRDIPFPEEFFTTVAQADAIEPCLALALDLHRSSNVYHRVRVIDSDENVRLVLDRLPVKDGKDK